MTNWILMPVKTGIAMTKNAIDSMLKQDIGNVRILVIDNSVDSGIRHMLNALYPNVISLYQYPPLSVAESWNRGIDLIFSEPDNNHILVCNNDIILRPDTYRMLVESGQPFVTAIGNDDPLCNNNYKPYMPIGCEDKVKIGKFIKMGIPLKGIVHVGTNEGYEIEWYQKLGLKVMGFEPYNRAFEICKLRFPDAYMHNVALSSMDKTDVLYISEGDGCGSTMLRALTDEKFPDEQMITVRRLDSFHIGPNYDCLVIDAQGMEMDVLKGAGDMIRQFKCLNIECSRTPIYEGEVAAIDIIEYLAKYDFVPITPIEVHNDILFVRKDVLGIRNHPDFSCYLITYDTWQTVGKFDEEFKIAFCEDWDYHCRLHALNINACCINVPFYHVGSATIKSLNEPEVSVIQRQADRNRAYFKHKWGFSGASKEYEEYFSVPLNHV